jgi:PAS domain S-box-containing protein
VNPAALRITGYEEEVIIGMHYPALIHPNMRSEAIKFFGRQFVKKLHNAYSEYPIITKEGHEIWLGQNTQLIVENGNVTGFQSVARDITDRKQAEEALQKSEENFRLSLDSSPLGVRISTIEAETLYANRAILDIYSYDSIEEMNKTPVKERYTPQSYAEYEIRKEKRTQGEFVPSEYEISIVRKNGEIRNLQVYRKEVIWNGTKQSQVIYKDITEHKRAEEKLNETLESLRESIKTTIQVLGAASEVRDPYTAGHQKRVADLARAIATEMKLSHDKIEGIRIAGSIHDIGKLSIPTEILSKPTKLIDIEFSLIKEHSRIGYEMLKDVDAPWPLSQIVYQHHERMNGSGYPRNLKGDEILLESRILAVADVVEAMASYRPYRPAMGIEPALEEIKKNKGVLYDNTVADACLRLFREKGYKLK